MMSDPSLATELPAGRQVGRYTITRRLGRDVARLRSGTQPRATVQLVDATNCKALGVGAAR